MNEMFKSNQELTMTTKQISELPELKNKTHQHIMTDTEMMLVNIYGRDIVDELLTEEYQNKRLTFISKNLQMLISKIDVTRFRDTYLDSCGREQNCYKLDKKHTVCLTGKYDDYQRMAILNYVEELENRPAVDIRSITKTDLCHMLIESEEELKIEKVKTKNLTDKNHLLEINLESAEESIIVAHEQIHQLEPKAEYADKIMSSVNLYTATNVCVKVGIRTPQIFNKLLLKHHVIKKGTGVLDYALTAQYCEEGYAEYIPHTHSRSSGLNETTLHLRWTQKGFDWLRLEKIPEILKRENVN